MDRTNLKLIAVITFTVHMNSSRDSWTSRNGIRALRLRVVVASVVGNVGNFYFKRLVVYEVVRRRPATAVAALFRDVP
jgi:hypothetical protein